MHVTLAIKFTAEEFQSLSDAADKTGSALVTRFIHDLAVAHADAINHHPGPIPPPAPRT